MKTKSLFILAAISLACAFPVIAQNKAPDQIPGEVVYIAYPVAITLDGNFDDWAGIPKQVVSTGVKKSPISTQTKDFDFSVASDATNLYVYMHCKDSKIIAGKHGKEFYNEDSLEFYFNLSGNLAAKAYAPGIFQLCVGAVNIGNKPGSALSVFGTNSNTAKIVGTVVKTADGWAFEASVPLGDVKAEHGLTVGFQAHANGATDKDRDCKLIWSKLDKSDSSYMNPAVFGKAVFFKVGSTDTPTAK